MANTRSSALSIRLKPEIKKQLAKLAKASGRSSNFLISDAVESYVADQEQMLAELRHADQQVKSGHYIRHGDMKAWLLSWGTDHELPLPKCVCGASMMTGSAGRDRMVTLALGEAADSGDSARCRRLRRL